MDWTRGIAQSLLGEAYKDQAAKVAAEAAAQEFARQKSLIKYQDTLTDENVAQQQQYETEVAKKNFQNQLIKDILGSDTYLNAPEVMSKYAQTPDAAILNQLQLNPKDKTTAYQKWLMGQPTRDEQRFQREAALAELNNGYERLKKLEEYGNASWTEYNTVIEDINKSKDNLKKLGISLSDKRSPFPNPKDVISKDVLKAFGKDRAEALGKGSKILVVSPDGREGYIPASQWEDAQKEGYKKK